LEIRNQTLNVVEYCELLSIYFVCIIIYLT